MKLKEIREIRHKSQQDVATYLGVSRQCYNNYELEKREPDKDSLIKIANYFDVSIDYLLGRTDVPAINKQHKGPTNILYQEINLLTQEELKKVSEYIEFLKSQRTKRIHLAPGTELAAQGGDFACMPGEEPEELL